MVDFENIIEILEIVVIFIRNKFFKDIELLFRGSCYDDVITEFGITDRIPKDTSTDISDIFNDYCLE
jgi:hypothetical protein